MQGKKWLIVLAIVALLIVGVWYWWKAPNSAIKQEAEKLKPELRVSTFNITDIDEDKLSATAKLVISSNLPIEVKTNRLDYVIYIDSAKVIEDSYTKPLTIRSGDTTAITLPLEVMFRKIGAVLKHFDNDDVDSADYTIKASFQVDVPIAGERNFTMDLSKRLPAFKLLKSKLGDLDIGKFGFKETDLNLVVNVTNPNVFPLQIANAKYKFSIDNDENIMEGQLQKVVKIPPKSTEPVAMHVDMKTMKVPKLGFKMLFDKKDTRFKLNYTANLISANGMLNNSKIAFNMGGTLEELKNAVKKK